MYYKMSDEKVDSPLWYFARKEFERTVALPNASIQADQALLLMNDRQGQLDNFALWARIHQRLRSQPATPQDVVTLFELLAKREKGLELDDHALDEAFMLMFAKVKLPPDRYVVVADHALRYSHDEPLARQLLSMAVERSAQDPAYVAFMADQLRSHGQANLADFVEERARELKITH
jgi:hypothetical protein